MITCVLFCGQIVVKGHRWPVDNVRMRPKPGNRWYVSFYYDGWRHWANWITEGEPFIARRTRDYFCSGGSGHHNVIYQRHKRGLP